MPDKSPINQAAKQALIKLKVKPNPTDLYLIQLLEWDLQKGRPTPGSRGAEMRSMFQDVLAARQPQELMRVFLEDPENPEEPSALLDLCSQGKPVDPENLIAEAWEQLEAWMSVCNLWADSPAPGQAGL
jgi:hypothetical protein